MSANQYDARLEELTSRSVGRLMTAEVFDAQAFDALRDYLWQKAEALRSEPAISKQVLSTIRSAIQAIESRAEHLPEARLQLARAREFDGMLDRLIAGEVRGDRQPGVPRII